LNHYGTVTSVLESRNPAGNTGASPGRSCRSLFESIFGDVNKLPTLTNIYQSYLLRVGREESYLLEPVWSAFVRYDLKDNGGCHHQKMPLSGLLNKPVETCN